MERGERLLLLEVIPSGREREDERRLQIFPHSADVGCLVEAMTFDLSVL